MRKNCGKRLATVCVKVICWRRRSIDRLICWNLFDHYARPLIDWLIDLLIDSQLPVLVCFNSERAAEWFFRGEDGHEYHQESASGRQRHSHPVWGQIFQSIHTLCLRCHVEKIAFCGTCLHSFFPVVYGNRFYRLWRFFFAPDYGWIVVRIGDCGCREIRLQGSFDPILQLFLARPLLNYLVLLFVLKKFQDLNGNFRESSVSSFIELNHASLPLLIEVCVRFCNPHWISWNDDLIFSLHPSCLVFFAIFTSTFDEVFGTGIVFYFFSWLRWKLCRCIGRRLWRTPSTTWMRKNWWFVCVTSSPF